MNTPELLAALERTPDKLAAAIASLSDAQLHQRTPAGEFSPVENVCHLRDLEIEGYGIRIKRIIAEDNPSLTDFDGGKIAAERDYNSQDPHAALEAFTRARKSNIECVRAGSPAVLDRTATLEGVGSISLKDLLKMMREHDDGHLQTLL